MNTAFKQFYLTKINSTIMKFAPIVFAILTIMASCTDSSESGSFKAVETFPENSGSSPNAAQQGSAFSITTEAFYQGEFNPVSERERVVSLWLTPTFGAKMATDYKDKNSTIREEGSWKTLENGNLFLALTRVDDKDSMTLEFKTDGEKLVYVGNETSLNGLTLWVKALPESN